MKVNVCVYLCVCVSECIGIGARRWYLLYLHFILPFTFFTEVSLTYTVVLFSCVHKVTVIYVLFHYVYYRTLNIVPCAVQ